MKDFYRALLSSYKVKPYRDGFLLSADIMYVGADRKFSFYIKKEGDGFLISDRGETLSFLRENADASRYALKIYDIATRFEAMLDGGEILMVLPSYESGQTIRCLHKYLLVVGIIANIDII